MQDAGQLNWYGERRRGIEKICEQCSVTYKTRKGKRGENRRFCSNKCFNSFQVQKLRVEVECHACKKKVMRSKSKLKNSKHGVFFCSRICKDQAQSLKGNCEEIRPSHYGTGTGRSITKRVVGELNCCEDCKENRRYLLFIHHIDGNIENNDRVNLEILCSNCHVRRHLKLSGKKWMFDTKALTPRDLLSKL